MENYALSSHTVTFEALPEDQAQGLPRIDLPVVLIGRLADDPHHLFLPMHVIRKLKLPPL